MGPKGAHRFPGPCPTPPGKIPFTRSGHRGSESHFKDFQERKSTMLLNNSILLYSTESLLMLSGRQEENGLWSPGFQPQLTSNGVQVT